MSARIEVDEFVCIGSGTCVHLAPGAFELNDDGVAVVASADAAAADQIERAVRSCPTGAITFHDRGAS
jgi:ferredoxin